jgi:hypothetical protein
MMQSQFGLKLKGKTFSYKRPYLEWNDQVLLPTNYRLPEFTKFTGLDSSSTIEHVSRYLTQLGEASLEEAHQVQFFALSLSGPSFTWFSSLAVNSIANWNDLEKKFHTYFYTGTRERKITDLMTIKQRANESGVEFLQRFRGTRNLCFSLNLTDDQLAALDVQGMLPILREMLLGQEFDNLDQLAQWVTTLNSQFQSMCRDTHF